MTCLDVPLDTVETRQESRITTFLFPKKLSGSLYHLLIWFWIDFLLQLPQALGQACVQCHDEAGQFCRLPRSSAGGLEAAGDHPGSSDRQVWVPVFRLGVLSHPSRFHFVRAHFRFLPSFLPDCQPY